MARYKFGEAIEEDDILEIQGVEYHMVPLGMRAMRKMLALRKQLEAIDINKLGEEQINIALEVIIDSVVEEERDALRAHIEDRVPIPMIVRISEAIANHMSDLDPTVPQSSSDGSSTAGSPSTDTAPPEASIPSPSPSGEPSTSTSTPPTSTPTSVPVT